MSVSFRRALLLTVAMDLFLSVDLDHSRNEGEKKLLRRENEGERLKETTNKTQQKKEKKLKMKDLSGNTVQNTSSLLYITRMLSETRNVMFL